MNSERSNNPSLNSHRCPQSGCKDIGIRKLELMKGMSSFEDVAINKFKPWQACISKNFNEKVSNSTYFKNHEFSGHPFFCIE